MYVHMLDSLSWYTYLSYPDVLFELYFHLIQYAFK